MRSIKYIKHRRSKYKFPTSITQGHGNTKGRLRIGHVDALADIERALGRQLKIAKVAHRIGEWVFCELRNPAAT